MDIIYLLLLSLLSSRFLSLFSLSLSLFSISLPRSLSLCLPSISFFLLSSCRSHSSDRLSRLLPRAPSRASSSSGACSRRRSVSRAWPLLLLLLCCSSSLSVSASFLCRLRFLSEDFSFLFTFSFFFFFFSSLRSFLVFFFLRLLSESGREEKNKHTCLLMHSWTECSKILKFHKMQLFPLLYPSCCCCWRSLNLTRWMSPRRTSHQMSWRMMRMMRKSRRIPPPGSESWSSWGHSSDVPSTHPWKRIYRLSIPQEIKWSWAHFKMLWQHSHKSLTNYK